MNSTIQVLFFAAVLVAAIANVLWYRAKFIVQFRGLPMSRISHFQDLLHLRQLIRLETESSERRGLVRLQVSLYAAIALSCVLFVAFLTAWIASDASLDFLVGE